MEKKIPRHSAFEEALRVLDRRACTERELREKLFRFDYPAAEIAAAVNECRKRHFIDDREFAEAFSDELYRAGNGPRMIQMKLVRRGVGREEIRQALSGDPDREIESCRQAANAKWRSLRGESDLRKKREKLFRFLAARGFSSAVAQKMISEIRENDAINGKANTL